MVINVIWPLFKKELKSQAMLFGIFVGLILMYGFIVVTLFNPDPAEAGWLDFIIETYPEMMDLIGFNIADFTNYQLFISGYLYGMLFLLFGLIFAILLSNKLIFKYLDKGSFVYLHSTPHSRTQILFTQIKVLGTFQFLLALVMFLVVTLGGMIQYPDYVDPLKLLYLNFSYLLLMFALGSFNVFASSIFEGKLSFGLSVGVPVFFFFLQMIGNLGGDYEVFKYFTPFSLFNTDYIITYNPLSFIYNGVLIVMTILLTFLTFHLFNKRDLSI